MSESFHYYGPNLTGTYYQQVPASAESENQISSSCGHSTEENEPLVNIYPNVYTQENYTTAALEKLRDQLLNISSKLDVIEKNQNKQNETLITSEKKSTQSNSPFVKKINVFVQFMSWSTQKSYSFTKYIYNYATNSSLLKNLLISSLSFGFSRFLDTNIIPLYMTKTITGCSCAGYYDNCKKSIEFYRTGIQNIKIGILVPLFFYELLFKEPSESFISKNKFPLFVGFVSNMFLF